MCRLLAWAARTPLSVAEALGDEEIAAFTALSRQHSDGWGMAWWVPGGELGILRSTLCAADDPTFADQARSVASDAGFAHLRWATPGLPVVVANTHPFGYRDLAFAHNGAIHPQERLDEILPDGWNAAARGTTDSERYFLAIVAAIAEGLSVHEAVAAVVRRLFADFEPTSLNAMLLGRDALYVVSAHDPARVPALGASSGGDTPSTDPDTVFYDLSYRVRDDSIVVASSGFPQPLEDGWEPLANMQLLRIERGSLKLTVTPLAEAAVPIGP